MKKLTRRAFTAAGILAAMGAAGAGLRGCNPFDPSSNEIEDVYGPPADFGYPPEDDEIEVDVVEDDPDPADEPEPTDGDDPTDGTDLADEPVPVDEVDPADGPDPIDDFDPSANEIEDVYGPPSYFGLDDEDDFDAMANQLEGVYGPPAAG